MVDEVGVMVGASWRRGLSGHRGGPRFTQRDCGCRRGPRAVSRRQQAAVIGGDPLHDAGQAVQARHDRAAVSLQACREQMEESDFYFLTTGSENCWYGNTKLNKNQLLVSLFSCL